MQKRTNAPSLHSISRKSRWRLGQIEATQPGLAAPALAGRRAKDAPLATDDAACRAMAWIERGQPDAEIVFDEIAPKQTPEELAKFKKASLKKTSSRAKG